MRQSFKVSFYLRSNYENKEGKSPVMLRIFLGGAMSDLGSTKIFVDKSQWNNNIKPKNSANCKTASEVSPRTKQVQKKYLNSPYLIKAMKARNKFEAAVMQQSKHLRPITKQQIKWAFRECISHFAYRLPKDRTTCMDCGHSWVMNKPRETCTCPHCRAKLQVQTTRARKHKEQHYFTILTTSGNYQVLRMCNKNTGYYDQIVNLVNANKRLIRQRMRQTA